MPQSAAMPTTWSSPIRVSAPGDVSRRMRRTTSLLFKWHLMKARMGHCFCVAGSEASSSLTQDERENLRAQFAVHLELTL